LSLFVPNMKNIYLQLLEHQSDLSSLVLATVTSTQGSTPQKPGSSALFDKTGLIAGTVGGGVVEGRVCKLAIASISSKKSGHFLFNLANSISKKEEAICGGQISVLIDANLQNFSPVLKELAQSVKNRLPGVLITMVTNFSEDMVLVNRYWMTGSSKPSMPAEFLSKIEPVVGEMIKKGDPSDYREMDLSIPEEEPVSHFFLEPVFPSEHLIIAGAGHIGKALAHLASLLSFEVTVIDDRPEFANSVNLPDADHIITEDIGEAMRKIKKANDTYVVIVTRGHKDDAAALKPCIGSELAYTGMIGSMNKIASMRVDFIENGWATAEQWDTVFTPVGLEIKSRTVEEIAISIAAQLVLIRNSKIKKT
jgi:xanthine dehydrogenase accessory factor